MGDNCVARLWLQLLVLYGVCSTLATVVAAVPACSRSLSRGGGAAADSITGARMATWLRGEQGQSMLHLMEESLLHCKYCWVQTFLCELHYVLSCEHRTSLDSLNSYCGKCRTSFLTFLTYRSCSSSPQPSCLRANAPSVKPSPTAMIHGLAACVGSSAACAA